MSVALILKYPHETLRQTCRPVAVDDAATMIKVRELALILRETMHDKKGWGLSAPQIGVPVRIFVVHVPTETKLPIVFVNPLILSTAFEPIELNEGCLSFPGIAEPVSRPKSVMTKRWDEHGRSDTWTYSGWTARAIYHEMEHLDGKLLIDQMLPAARRMVERRMSRQAIEQQQRREKDVHDVELRRQRKARKRAKEALAIEPPEDDAA